MGNIKIRNLDEPQPLEVTSGNFLAMALNPEDGHEKLTRKVTLEQVVSGGAVYADFSETLKVSGQSVLTGIEIPGGGSVVDGDEDNVNFGGSETDDDRDVNLYQGGEEKISLSEDVITIGGSDPSTDTVTIINPTTVQETFTVIDGTETILGGETTIKGKTTFQNTGNFTDASYLTFGNNPETTLQDLLNGVTINELSDIGNVSISNPSDGQVLKWDNTNSQWVAGTDNEGLASVSWNDVGGKPSTFDPSAHSLSSHSDVSATAPANGQVLKWNGTEWAPGTDDAGTTISSLNDVGGVTISNAVDGDALVYNGSNWVNSQPAEPSLFVSDEKLKKDAATIESPHSKLKTIKGVNFTWSSLISNQNLQGTRDIGVIAQDVQKVIPSAVKNLEGYLSVEYHKIIPLLVECVKSSQKEIDLLKSRISDLEKKL